MKYLSHGHDHTMHMRKISIQYKTASQSTQQRWRIEAYFLPTGQMKNPELESGLGGRWIISSGGMARSASGLVGILGPPICLTRTRPPDFLPMAETRLYRWLSGGADDGRFDELHRWSVRSKLCGQKRSGDRVNDRVQRQREACVREAWERMVDRKHSMTILSSIELAKWQ